MIIEKSTPVPEFYRRTVRLQGCVSLRSEEGKLCAERCLNFRQENESLVCGEGAEVLYSLPQAARLFACGGMLYSYADGVLSVHSGGTVVPVGEIADLHAMIALTDADGEARTYAVTQSGMYRVEDGLTAVEGAFGGVCAAYHYERLFTAKGMRVYYSKALDAESYTLTEQGAGYLDLPDQGGDILALVPFKAKLYAFRERGIMQLRVLGDTLNFKAVTMPYSCGKLYGGTVVNCGSRVLFLTENGLYAFKGATCTRLSGYGRILSENPVAAACGSRYYLIAGSDGEEGILYPDASGIGLAIANRLNKAAGFHIIEV